MRISIPVVATVRWSAPPLLMRKLRSARLWLSCLALAGFACATFLSVASFAQAVPPLSFGDNFFVTGDYVVAGAYGMTTKFSNGYAVGTFSVPDPNPGIRAIPFVPPGAEVVGAIVYWQTVENSATTPGQPGTGQNGYFRPLIASGPPAPGYPITGVNLPGLNNAVTWSSGGCAQPEMGKITRTYRANVLGAFPQDSKGNIDANGEFEIRLPSVGTQTPLTLGATLVIIYRILSPNVPLNSIVIYDGAYGQTTTSLNMTQTIQGFYDAAHNPVSKLTLIAGAGESNKSQTVYLNNEALPSHAGHNEPPFPGYYGHWDNPTWTFGENPIYPEVANPIHEDAASVPIQVVPAANGPGCLSWGAVILSTTVKNTGNDGLLDSWKTAGGYCDASMNGGVCNKGNNSDPAWVALPGATVGKKDLFIQLDYMCSLTTGIDSCQTGDGTNYSFHPPQNALSTMLTAFSGHGITVHINPVGTIQNVHAIPELTCADVLSPQLALCPFPGQPGVVGWKGGYSYFKNQLVDPDDGSVNDCLGQPPAEGDCIPRFQHGRKDSWHYALFAHAVGRPEWKVQDGTLTSVVQSGNTVTFTTSTPLGNQILVDPNCANGPTNGRVSVYYASTNTNLNGTFCIQNSSANTFTITIPGTPESAHFTLSTDPYLSVAPGQTSSASGVSDVGGSDSLITLGLWGNPALASSDGQQPNTLAGTFMHEIGHSLGLTHGGFYYDPQLPGSYIPTIEPNCKPNFQSVMNYYFQVDLLNLNGTLDYSEQQLDSLNEAKLPGGVTFGGKAPLYLSTNWYTPNPPQGVGTRVSFHCDGTPPLQSDPVTFLVAAGTAYPTAMPAWNKAGSQDVDFNGVITKNLRGYDDWAPGGTLLTGFTTGIDLRQIGATGNSSVFSQANFFGGGQPLNGGGQPLNGGGQPLNGGGQPLNGGGQPLNGGGQPLNGGGQPLNGGGEIDQKTANSYTRPPTSLGATEGTSARTINLTWMAPTFGQIGMYKVYRKPAPNTPNGFGVIATISGVNSNPPVTTYLDTTDTCVPAGYQYFVTAELANTAQESVPSNIVSTIPPSANLLTGCYTLRAISLPASAVQGSIVPMTWSLADDFYTTGNVVNNLQANTLVAIGPGGRTTLLSHGVVTAPQGGASTFGFSNNQFTFNWDSDQLSAGSYTFELDLDSGQSQTTTTPLQLSIDVNDSDSTPHITTTALPAGTVGNPYSDTLTQDGGTSPFTWSFSGSLPPGISQQLQYFPTLSGTTCAAGLYNFTATVTDSKSNSGAQALTLLINKANTTTGVISNANSSAFQQMVTFTVTVAPQYSCTPTGTVTLLDGAVPIASSLQLAGGIATFTTSALSVGIHSITVSYGGDTNFNSSNSTTLSQTVNMASTMTAINYALPSPALVGQAITVAYNFVVMPPGAGIPIGPSGTMNVTASDGSSCIVPAALGTGVCVLSPTSTAAGIKTLTITYPGDNNFVTSGANGNFTVNPTAPTNLYASTITSTAVNLVWAPSTASNVTGYNVYRSLSPAGPFGPPAIATGVAGTTFSDPAVTTSTTYYYTVTTTAGGLESPDSNIERVPFGFAYELIQPTTSPSARCCVAMADPGNFTVLFGGTVPGQGYAQVNDTWEFQSGQWTQIFPAIAPPARSGAAMVFFPPTGQIVLFGGTFGGSLPTGDYNDTWIFDETNSTWTQVIPSGVSPPGRRFDSQGMAYDPNTQTIVMFGGISFDDMTFFNDTWVLAFNTGSWTWTQQTPTTSPSPRRTVLATDPSGNVMLFGGTGPTGDLADTWVWGGAAWAQQSPVASPAPRDMHSMDFDPDLGEVVLFGGSTAQATVGYNDTWTWDGANWTQVSLATTPPQRYAFGLDYDATAQALVIFGGFTANGSAINDTWALGLAPQPPVGLEAAPPAPGAGQVMLSWTVSPTPNVSYNVKRGITTGGPYMTIASLGAVTTFTDTGLTPGTYYYVVTAVTGPGGVESASSNEESVSVLPPAPPTTLTAAANTTSPCSVALTWTASSSNVTGYNVYQEISPAAAFTEIAGINSTFTTFADNSNSVCTTGAFTYQVTAVGPTGIESVPSNLVTVTFSPPQP